MIYFMNSIIEIYFRREFRGKPFILSFYLHCYNIHIYIQEIVATAPKHPSNHPWFEQENVSTTIFLNAHSR